MSVTYFHELEQRSPAWHDLRRGMITASEMSKIITPTLKIAANAQTKQHLYDLLAQRITGHTEDHFVGYAMERGQLEETDARIAYTKELAEVKECGFVINDDLGFPIGYSPDGLVGERGQIEIKSRLAKFQVQTIVDHIADRVITENETRVENGVEIVTVPDPAKPLAPVEFMLQIQTGLFVTGRDWCDFTSYSNGLNMAVMRVVPIDTYFEAIEKGAKEFEAAIKAGGEKYAAALQRADTRIFPVVRQDYSEEIAA